MLLVKAFDRLDVSFVPLAGTAPAGLTPDRYVLRIWTPVNLAPDNRLTNSGRPRHPGDARSIKLWVGKKQPHTIGEYDGNELMHGASAGQAPLKRALSYQAWLAYNRAKKLHWLADDEEGLPEEFGTPNDSPFQQLRRLRDTAQRRAQAQQEEEEEEEEEEQSEQGDEDA